MTRMIKIPGLLLAGCALATGVNAAQAQDEEKEIPYLDSSVSVGFLGTSGNTEVKTYNFEYLADYYTENWTHKAKFQAVGSKQDGENKSERYYLEDKSDYNLSDINYLYVKFTYTDDRFSGFDYQTDLSVGYGRHLIQRDTFELQGFTGIGYRESDITDNGKEDEFIFTIGEELSWDLSDTSKLFQSLTFDIGEIRTVTKFQAGLEALIVDRLTTRIVFEYRNSSEVPVGTEKTDTLTSLNLTYNF